MIPRPANWSRPASAASAVAAGLVAVVLFLVVWGVLHRGFFTHHPIVDTPVYERYGSAMDDGRVPYRDFSVEYPPGALPVFVLPALGDVDSETFRVRFEGLMVSLGEAMLVCVPLALRPLARGAHGGRSRRPRRRAWASGARRAWSGRGGEALPGCARAARPRLRLAEGRQARGARLRRDSRGSRRGRVRAVRCGGTGWGLGRTLEPGLAAAPDREPRLRVPPRRAPRLRDRRHDAVEPRLAEPGGRASGRPGRRSVGGAGAHPRRDLGRLRARSRGPGAARRCGGGRTLRLGRARQGVLAAVPDLADPGRPACSRPARPLRVRPSRACARPHADLVPVPLLGPRPALRRAALVARPRP